MANEDNDKVMRLKALKVIAQTKDFAAPNHPDCPKYLPAVLNVLKKSGEDATFVAGRFLSVNDDFNGLCAAVVLAGITFSGEEPWDDAQKYILNESQKKRIARVKKSFSQIPIQYAVG